MKNTVRVCAALALFAAAPFAFANIAMPAQPPYPAGDVLALDASPNALRIEREDLRLDLTGRPQAFSSARYLVANPGAQPLATDLYFVTPSAEQVTVMINGAAAPVALEKLTRGRLPWQVPEDGYRWWGSDAILTAFRFRVSFAAGTTTEIVVAFQLPSGYDNRNVGRGSSSAASAHALNWSKDKDNAAWYVYSLESGRTFKGGMGELSVELLVPAGTEVEKNLELGPGATADGLTAYKGTFQGFPVPEIKVKVITRHASNLFGATFSCGFTTSFAGYTAFRGQALIDFFFLSHQISTGAEFNPFGSNAGLTIPVLYSFIFGTEREAYLAFIADLRLTAGVLVDVLPSTAAGFRVGAGARFFMMLVEIAYDFYPFDPALGWVGRLTFLGKISI